MCKRTGLDPLGLSALDSDSQLELAMIDPIEERLQDLERLVLKQAERIDLLEDRLEVMHRLARQAVTASLSNTKAA
jgi:nitrogen-specific signal transduction histidine kinase